MTDNNLKTYKVVFVDDIVSKDEEEAKAILLSVLQEKVNSEDLSCFDINQTSDDEEEEEQGFTFRATTTMEVMDTDVESARAWFENHIATDSRYLDFDIEEVSE